MEIKTFSPEEIELITRRSLRDNFPLYQEEHNVDSSPLGENGLWIGYRPKGGGIFRTLGSTHFDLNVIRGIFYLVSIGLEKSQMGKGLGWKLYETTHQIAKDLGHQFVRTRPSGWFIRENKLVESRRDYLLRKGYVPGQFSELDWIITSPSQPS